jgi:1-acyl-sn-glycerol-3-phosphate acyltransferase
VTTAQTQPRAGETTGGHPPGWRPGPIEQQAITRLLAPWRAYTEPRFTGLEHVPTDGAVLLVGNHTTLGVLDMPLMLDALRRERGRFVRGLADHGHFAIPGYRELFMRIGAVRGTRENCRDLLAAGEAVLVYPGGGREVTKRKGEKYQLIWKQRTGFARMAIEAGCPIIPFGAIGAEETYDIVLDADSRLMAPLRALSALLGVREDLMAPLVRGLGGTPLPRPGRYYFAFGEPIHTTDWAGNHDDDHALRAVRDLTRNAVEEQIALLLTKREHDPQHNALARVSKRLRRTPTLAAR